MAVQISNWLSAQLLNAALRSTNFTAPTSVYLALYTSDPTAADTGAEVTGGGYVRKAITFAAPALVSGRQTVSSAVDVEFPIATADWGLVTHVGIRDAATGGNLLWTVALPSPRTIQTGDKPKFLASGVTVAFVQ
ncbi:hypothetical protein DCC85_14245 [Paenibacillus sp. CAA11]|uniref:phage tail fiber protein n=1 Tax=Paenibacillus sp. CAA11 TaxID=1532905 RepID=UPI000D38E345|nr:hypothetical protein [Paenibacillus sp. CAA11]AWB45270.1 hypothetical protein DCC85_14245 [Paenibacillus sp. CAA11]